jgi:hypothetical protein
MAKIQGNLGINSLMIKQKYEKLFILTLQKIMISMIYSFEINLKSVSSIKILNIQIHFLSQLKVCYNDNFLM